MAAIALEPPRSTHTATPANDRTLVSTSTSTVISPKRLARVAGFLYLLVGITGGFAEGFVEPTMYVAGDAAATAAKVVANAGLVRLGVVSDLLDQALFVFLAMTLYVLLQHVQQSVARAMLVLVTLAAGVASLNTLFLFQGLQVATGAVDMSALGTAGSNAVVLLLLDAQHYGLLIAQIFFGLWLVPLGYLAHKSGWFPTALSALLVAAGAAYIVDLLAAFLAPDVSQTVRLLIVPVVTIAEIWMVFYLLVIGVKTTKPIERAALSGEAI